VRVAHVGTMAPAELTAHPLQVNENTAKYPFANVTYTTLVLLVMTVSEIMSVRKMNGKVEVGALRRSLDRNERQQSCDSEQTEGV
jgi:hypothetical protein